jgi:succinyl-CoA synthetase beta subunit
VPSDLSDEPFELFAQLGIPVAQWAIAEAPEFRHPIAYPVALKLLEAHKTERGGVMLGIADREEFEKAVRKMGANRVLVQRMHSGLAEAIVGYRDDAVVGPLVLVGVGGVLAEVYRDTVLRIAPVSEEEAEEMIAQVKGFAAIRGYRNLPRGDVAALARAVSALSRLALATGRPVQEAEINPLIVSAEGVVAVDALVVRKGAG